MSAGDAVAADVPTKYDVVINGKGYLFLDQLEESIPFRTHRAVYGATQPFVERQNVSNSYGDNAQDFFLTVRQRDWSLGEQQKFFRAGNDGRYWMGSNVNVSIPGQVTLSNASPSISIAATVLSGSREGNSLPNLVTAGSTNLYRVAADGTSSSLGAHGLGTTPDRFGVCGDGRNVFLSSETAGSVGVRKWDLAAFSTFSATAVHSLAFLNNTLYGAANATDTLYRYDTAGTATALYQWKDAAGAGGSIVFSKIEPFGGTLLILFSYGQEVGSELWVYDGSGTRRLEIFPPNFLAYDIEVLYGVAYISGSFLSPTSSTLGLVKPSVLFYDGSQLGKLWEANSYSTFTVTLNDPRSGPHAALGVVDGHLVFTDDTTGNLTAYDPALGGVSTIGSYTVAGDQPRIITSGTDILHTRNQSTAYFYKSGSYNTSGYVISSLVDFDSSLTKVFRGVTLEFDAATDGNGGSIDVSYQLNGLGGSWTSLATGVTSGTETQLPAATSGHSIAVKVTLNKGTSTAGPTLKSMSVRGAPVMPAYPRGEYILDCTATKAQPRELRNGTQFHPLTGYDQVANLVVAKNSLTPITITDKVNGTYTAFVDVNDPQGFDVYEVHPSTETPGKPGSFVVRLTCRGV